MYSGKVSFFVGQFASAHKTSTIGLFADFIFGSASKDLGVFPYYQ